MERTEKRTAELYGKIFTSFTEKEFYAFQEMVSPKAFGEPDNFFQGKRVLELGCGGLGYSIASFLRNGASEIVAVDLSQANINNVLNKFKDCPNVKFLNLDICSLPLNQLGEFDFIYSNGVIHHTRSPQKIISDVYSLLKKNGIFIIGLYGGGGIIPFFIRMARLIRFIIPESRLFAILNKRWKFGAFYIMDYIFVPILRRYTEKEAIFLLREAGFKEIRRLKNVATTKGALRVLQQSQVDHRKLLSRVLHGHGFILLKGTKC